MEERLGTEGWRPSEVELPPHIAFSGEVQGSFNDAWAPASEFASARTLVRGHSRPHGVALRPDTGKCADNWDRTPWNDDSDRLAGPANGRRIWVAAPAEMAERLLQVIDASLIEALSADREFISIAWGRNIQQQKISSFTATGSPDRQDRYLPRERMRAHEASEPRTFWKKAVTCSTTRKPRAQSELCFEESDRVTETLNL